ncbi:MAG: hypothetical protein NC432_06815 [Roseburia sp.]|nr:hypothetical protein [Roseburia sp.]
MEGRIDPFYYKSDYRLLEKAVLKNTKHKLRDFIIYMAGGATPSKDEKGKYYTDASGIPFIRVQNLTPEGLNLNECVFINEYTHNNMLSRSKVKGNDLLVKITGVGRMAVSSVAPQSFDGNINQHIVVIKTKDRQTSEWIAAYLNSDIGEKLASRRSTGGTRPALDYAALRSIPVIMKEDIVKIMESAYEQKRQKECQVQKLLDGINSYLIDALGIALPPENADNLSGRMFYVHAVDLLGGRFDPRKYSKKYRQILSAIESASCDRKPLKEIIKEDTSGDWGMDDSAEDPDLISCLTIRGTEFDNKFNLNLDNSRTKFRKYRPELFDKIKLTEKDILIEKSGGSEDQPVGRVAFIEKTRLDSCRLAFSNFIHRIRIDEEKAVPEYVFEYLRLMHNIKITEVMQTQTNGIRNLIMREYFTQIILLPEPDEQREIAVHAARMRKQAYELQIEAKKIVEDAKRRVEKILLGEKE